MRNSGNFKIRNQNRKLCEWKMYMLERSNRKSKYILEIIIIIIWSRKSIPSKFIIFAASLRMRVNKLLDDKKQFVCSHISALNSFLRWKCDISIIAMRAIWTTAFQRTKAFKLYFKASIMRISRELAALNNLWAFLIHGGFVCMFEPWWTIFNYMIIRVNDEKGFHLKSVTFPHCCSFSFDPFFE